MREHNARSSGRWLQIAMARREFQMTSARFTPNLLLEIGEIPGPQIDLPRKFPNADCNSHAHLFVPNADVPLNYSTQLRPSSTPPRRLPAAAGPAEINFSKHDLMGNIKMPSCITKAQGEQVELRGGAKGRGGEGGKRCRRRRRLR